MPDTLKTIEDCAFKGCSRLTAITIPDSVKTIGYYAFSDCKKLTAIKIPVSVKTIESGAFSGCRRLATITVEKKNAAYDSRNSCNALIETSTNTLIQGCKNTVIPDSVTAIGKYAFNDCTKLTAITIPSEVLLSLTARH